MQRRSSPARSHDLGHTYNMPSRPALPISLPCTHTRTQTVLKKFAEHQEAALKRKREEEGEGEPEEACVACFAPCLSSVPCMIVPCIILSSFAYVRHFPRPLFSVTTVAFPPCNMYHYFYYFDVHGLQCDCDTSDRGSQFACVPGCGCCCC